MGKRKEWTEAEVELVNNRRAQGWTWEKIAEELGRGRVAVYSKFAKIAQAKKKRGPYRKTFKPNKPIEEQRPLPRPMIALVGQPDEVTKTIRELFS